MRYTGMLIVIPTRNRADLVPNAISSVFSQPGCEVDVLVSDNSTSAQQRSQLSRYCQQAANPRLRYIAAPEPLPMSEHWDWAMQQALSLYDVSHVCFLTDRMMVKPGALKSLVEIVLAYPDKILTYMHDMVDDFAEPIVVHQYTWTGSLYEVPATRLLEMIAQSVLYDSCIPRMLNCIVPRHLLKTLKRRFGTIFESVSPDWNFACRALEMEDAILFHDKAALVHYAQRRSNGQSTHRGVMNEAQAQFIGDLKGGQPNSFAPFPEILTVWNGIISEYSHVKEATQSPKFPEVDLDNYRRALAFGVDQIKNPQRQKQMRAFLEARGWKRGELPILPPQPPPGVEAFAPNALEFQNLEDAMEHALRRPRDRAHVSDHKTLIQGVERPVQLEVA
jgi:hypothetical protein